MANPISYTYQGNTYSFDPTTMTVNVTNINLSSNLKVPS
jgi:hypothetical protein